MLNPGYFRYQDHGFQTLAVIHFRSQFFVLRLLYCFEIFSPLLYFCGGLGLFFKFFDINPKHKRLQTAQGLIKVLRSIK